MNARRPGVLGLLESDRGSALIMALGVLVVLTTLLGSVLGLATSGSRDAARLDAGQNAYALAEAGLNDAISALSAHYPESVIYPGDSSYLPAGKSTYSTGTSYLVRHPRHDVGGLERHGLGSRQESHGPERGGRQDALRNLLQRRRERCLPQGDGCGTCVRRSGSAGGVARVAVAVRAARCHAHEQRDARGTAFRRP